MYEAIDLNQFCKEKVFEICALKMKIKSAHLLVLCVYRSPSGDFSYFLTQLERVLNKLYNITTSIILCGDFNVNFMDSSSRSSALESLLHSFCLESICEFHTRIVPNSQTLIDNIFLDKKALNPLVYPLLNGLSDHDAQLVTLLNLNYSSSKSQFIHRRMIEKYSIQKFIDLLSHESWEIVFSNDNINTIFNSFLDIYLKIQLSN